jgi:hypothetical protein
MQDLVARQCLVAWKASWLGKASKQGKGLIAIQGMGSWQGKARSRVKAIKAREGLAVRQSKARGAKASWNVKAWQGLVRRQGIVARQGKTSW